MNHLIIRKNDVLCTRCLTTEPVNAGHGTPIDTLLLAYKLWAERHRQCKKK
jgi:hypothetical protein